MSIFEEAYSLKNEETLMKISGFDIYLSRKRIKNINLRIGLGGQVKISIPMSCSLSMVEQLLEEKKDWILKYSALRRIQPQIAPVQFSSGSLHLYLGKTYPLMIHEYSDEQQFVLEEGSLNCYLKNAACDFQVSTLIMAWYRHQMESLVPDLMHKWQSMIGVQVNHWGIKSMKTRWGSCQIVKKSICLNLRLIYKPLICLEYVIVHELVHLLEPSHNPRFYRLMTQFMPDWQMHKDLLNKSS